MKKKLLKLGLFSLASSLIYIEQNKLIKKTKHTILNNKIPSSFHNFKIVQLSDIHCEKIGLSDQLFFESIKKEKPNIIVITGDILDSYRNQSEVAHNILTQICDIAPCYFVSGNHELRLLKEYDNLKNVFEKLNIINLSNENKELVINGEKINLVGVEDFNYFIKKDKENYYAHHYKMLKNLYNEQYYNILLAHRPEKFSIYEEIGYNLIFSGHAHGGQWNIPFIGRIFSPSQGFFPVYTNGIYKKNNSELIVSQGLGNSSFPMRINNKLELVVVTLKKS